MNIRVSRLNVDVPNSNFRAKNLKFPAKSSKIQPPSLKARAPRMNNCQRLWVNGVTHGGFQDGERVRRPHTEADIEL
jgi:hypothetical protein